MNKCGMFSATAHSHVLVQPRFLVPLALPIDPAYPRCVQLFPGHFPQLPLYYFFIPIFFLFLRLLCLQATFFPDLPKFNLLIFAQLQEKFLFHPIFSSFLVYIFFLWAYSLSKTQWLSSYFIFSFVWSIAWWRPAQAGSGTSYILGATLSQLVVPVPLTSLFAIPWFDISPYLRLCFMVSTNK